MCKILLVVATILAVCQEAPAADYSTQFATAENPISENGVWQHVTSTWKHVRVIGDGTVDNPHRAVGNDNLFYDDAYAHLSGFTPDQAAEAVIWIDPQIPAKEIHEAELHLRWADTASGTEQARGYELYFAYDGRYYGITRWNGPYGDFKTIAEGFHLKPVPKTGDTLRGTAIGNTISFYIDRHDGAGFILLVSAADSTWRDGNPGIGFCQVGDNRHGPGSEKFGFTQFTARQIE